MTTSESPIYYDFSALAPTSITGATVTSAPTNGRSRVLAAIDIGTNSIRLEVVRVESDHSITTLSQQKETVRLGENEFDAGFMSAAALERGTLVCARFADVARGVGADEIVAVA